MSALPQQSSFRAKIDQKLHVEGGICFQEAFGYILEELWKAKNFVFFHFFRFFESEIWKGIQKGRKSDKKRDRTMEKSPDHFPTPGPHPWIFYNFIG